jgi:hypothetical protein
MSDRHLFLLDGSLGEVLRARVMEDEPRPHVAFTKVRRAELKAPVSQLAASEH